MRERRLEEKLKALEKQVRKKENGTFQSDGKAFFLTSFVIIVFTVLFFSLVLLLKRVLHKAEPNDVVQGKRYPIKGKTKHKEGDKSVVPKEAI
ncbi:MAG: hypothetical protein AAF335_01825 [Bacteroidota bacterium]